MTIAESRRHIALPAVVAAAVLAAVGAVAFGRSTDVLRVNLQQWEFWVLEVLLAGTAVTTFVEMRRLEIGRGVVRWAVAIGVAAIALNATVPPATNRIYYDEHIYQGIGQNLADSHQAQMCNDGTLEYGRLQCWRGEFNKEPNGYPHLLSVVYRIVGAHERAAGIVNNVAGGATASVAVLLAWLLFADIRVAALSGLILALLPMQMWWSNTAAAESSAALFTALSVLAAVHWARVGTPSALAWVVVTTAYATTFRPESVLTVPLVGLVTLMLTPRALQRRSTWWGVAAGAALSAVSVLHLAAVRNDGWGTSQAKFAWGYVRSNLPANGLFYLGADDRFPILVGLLMLAAIARMRPWRPVMLLVTYFIIFWGIFVAFYAGSYYYGADVRYSVLSHVPLSLLAGLGAARAADLLERWWSPRTAVAAVVAALLLQFSWQLPVARSTGEEAWAARADVEYARQFIDRLPANSIVLTHNPSVFHLQGQNAAQLSLTVTDPEYVRRHLFDRYAGGVFLHWNFWCNVSDPVQVAFCQKALDAFASEEIASARERNYEYRLYRLRMTAGSGT